MNRTIAAGLVLVVLTVALGSIVASKTPSPLDVWLLRHIALTDHSPVWLIGSTRALTAFGYVGARSIAVVVVLALLLARTRWSSALLFLTTIGLSIAGHTYLKGVFARPRPHLVPWLDTPTELSYPSGHAAASMVVLLGIALFFDRWHVRTAAILLSLAIGATRPMLGVHWPSDVLGGWLWGAGFALLGAGVAQATGLLDARQGQRGAIRIAPSSRTSSPLK